MKKRIFSILLLCLALNPAYGADNEDQSAETQSSAQAQGNAANQNIARGPVTNVPPNGGYDLRDPRYYNGRYYNGGYNGGGYYQPPAPNYYQPQRYDPYDPRNYERY